MAALVHCVCVHVCVCEYLSAFTLLLPFTTCIAVVDFSDEEGYGKFLDLHAVYYEFLNLKQFEVSWKPC